jgi:hypothetical protein
VACILEFRLDPYFWSFNASAWCPGLALNNLRNRSFMLGEVGRDGARQSPPKVTGFYLS